MFVYISYPFRSMHYDPFKPKVVHLNLRNSHLVLIQAFSPYEAFIRWVLTFIPLSSLIIDFFFHLLHLCPFLVILLLFQINPLKYTTYYTELFL